MNQEGYIVVVNWETFQHYKNRRPVWIKDYVDQLDRDEYLKLSAGDRALLQGVRLLTARVGNGRVPASERYLKGQLHLRSCKLDRLVEGGWVELVLARLPKCGTALEPNVSPELEIETELEVEEEPLISKVSLSREVVGRLVLTEEHDQALDACLRAAGGSADDRSRWTWATICRKFSLPAAEVWSAKQGADVKQPQNVAAYITASLLDAGERGAA